ncbi:hypothetical protein CLIB1423_35S00430 [[Candida] railenensis]|uniref:Uncharacterized protein n=1 Tax=[Candida] railenensis TaxID=45579 RepID=A0A9P0QVM9_9ASCO|nr:hypothetical protein CLIB1423_35S00430 [[Candida] railenensis]
MHRKAPPVEPISGTGLESEIDTYLKKSPVISQFREQNPNLQQFEDDSVQEVQEYTNDGDNYNSNKIQIENERPDFSSSDSFKNKLKRLSTSHSINSRFSKLNISRSEDTGIRSVANDGEEVPPFWKYHVLKFGKDLYLSTNPDIKHIYCRNGPGLYVEVISNKAEYSLHFRHIQGIEHPPFMIISKFMNNFIIDTIGEAVYSPVDEIDNNTSLRLINYNFSYEGKEWRIGSIPKTRLSKMNKLKGLVKGEEEELKYIGKKNLYFYNSENNTGVLGLFRPYEVKLRKKMVRSARNALKKEDQQPYNESDLVIGSNVNKFFQSTGDGLYNEVNPKDDTPNRDKMGWITIYENHEGLNPSHPLFNIIVGITLAIGYEQTFIE